MENGSSIGCKIPYRRVQIIAISCESGIKENNFRSKPSQIGETVKSCAKNRVPEHGPRLQLKRIKITQKAHHPE
jgi:hypothetical protein